MFLRPGRLSSLRRTQTSEEEADFRRDARWNVVVDRCRARRARRRRQELDHVARSQAWTALGQARRSRRHAVDLVSGGHSSHTPGRDELAAGSVLEPRRPDGALRQRIPRRPRRQRLDRHRRRRGSLSRVATDSPRAALRRERLCHRGRRRGCTAGRHRLQSRCIQRHCTFYIHGRAGPAIHHVRLSARVATLVRRTRRRVACERPRWLRCKCPRTVPMPGTIPFRRSRRIAPAVLWVSVVRGGVFYFVDDK